MSNNILIVIDFQNDFVTGPLGTPEAVALIPKIEKYVNKCRNKHYTIWWTTDEHYNLPTCCDHSIEKKKIPLHCEVGTKGCKIVNNMNKYEDVITKHTFAVPDWYDRIFGLISDNDTIEIIGVCTDICVISNTLMIRSICPNNRIIVHSDLCAGTTPEKHNAALEVMKSCLIEVD